MRISPTGGQGDAVRMIANYDEGWRRGETRPAFGCWYGPLWPRLGWRDRLWFRWRFALDRFYAWSLRRLRARGRGTR